MIYKNIITGAVLETASLCSGENWVAVENAPKKKPATKKKEESEKKED